MRAAPREGALSHNVIAAHAQEHVAELLRSAPVRGTSQSFMANKPKPSPQPSRGRPPQLQSRQTQTPAQQLQQAYRSGGAVRASDTRRAAQVQHGRYDPVSSSKPSTKTERDDWSRIVSEVERQHPEAVKTRNTDHEFRDEDDRDITHLDGKAVHASVESLGRNPEDEEVRRVEKRLLELYEGARR